MTSGPLCPTPSPIPLCPTCFDPLPGQPLSLSLCLVGSEEHPPVLPSPIHGTSCERPECYQAEPSGLLECYQCRYLCTARACCQLVEVLLTMLILICSSVSYSSTGGYTGIPSLGGIYYYQYGGAYSGLYGAEGEKAQQLDTQFYQLKLPTARAAMAVGGALMAFSCLLVLVGVLRLPWHFPAWLLLECTLDVLIALGFMPALYFYFHLLLDAYNSPVCKERENLYQSKGYQGFSCSVHGAEIAAGLFSCIAIVVFLVSAGLAVKGYKTVHQLREKPVEMYEF
ncbi:MARVEL domain-containing protein 3 isoform X1 [Dermochelys coriacea]|uniref:MARVEL domain-containing protein 3 isoform X1 n=1 Tax=Dermochelys coriacea TaxID=27794 RepID=UPI001CA9C82D|nr:MARVEL domain-containing protein 3 isoform X1 [Dermochelys coriacea]XP_043350684.1 MARVEL domain-containing protein 3 isoform X1 [Dermochelys coriacea]